MKFCTHCGREISEDDAFCPYCGEKVEIDTNSNVVATIKEDKKKENNNTNSKSKNAKVLGILSIVFSLGYVGLILGIIGLCIDPKGPYKTLNIIGISISGALILLSFFRIF